MLKFGCCELPWEHRTNFECRQWYDLAIYEIAKLMAVAVN